MDTVNDSTLRADSQQRWFTARPLTQGKPVPIGPEASRAELQRLISARDRAQEDERRRIARELHDDLQQSLAAIRIDAGALAELLPDASRPVSALLARVDQLAAAALVSVRRIVNDLRPELLEDLGLSTALQVLTRQFSERTLIVSRLEAQAEATQTLESAPLMETSLFRIVRESLDNVAEHAQARHVDVRLDLDARDAVRLSTRDDGCGMPEDDPRKPLSFGLLGMRERVQALGGTFRIDSAPGAGTTVTVVADIDACVGRAARPAGRRKQERLRG